MKTDSQIIVWLLQHYHEQSDRENQKLIGVGNTRYYRIVEMLVAEGKLDRKVQHNTKLLMPDNVLLKKYLNRTGSVPDLAKKLGVNLSYLEKRICEIRRKMKSPQTKRKKKMKPMVHPIVTKAWVPGFMAGAK